MIAASSGSAHDSVTNGRDSNDTCTPKDDGADVVTRTHCSGPDVQKTAGVSGETRNETR